MNRTLFYFLCFLIFSAPILQAQWQSTGFNQSAWLLCKAPNGNLLTANDVYPEEGGIYISEDNGATWTETEAEKHSYTAHLVTEDHVFMGGMDSHVAISADNGATWSISNFSHLFPTASPEEPIYAIEKHGDRIYASLFGHGIVFSEDQGVTWQLTDTASLEDPSNPDNGGTWCYNLRSFNGTLYNLGSFGIWKYNEAADSWTEVDSTWYASSSCIVDDTFYVVYNATGIPAGIRYTTNFEDWEEMPLPAGASTAIRILEFYQGAFFMGHVSEAVFYSLDQGQNWIEYRDNFPQFSPVPGIDIYGVPMSFVFKEDTMFAGVFSPFENTGGVYIAPVPDDVMNILSSTNSLDVKLYPNPASDYIVFELPNIDQGILKVTDLAGRLLFQKNIENTNSITIPTENYPSGLYIYSIDNNSTSTSGKFLVR